jgi:hypothetical protein
VTTIKEQTLINTRLEVHTAVLLDIHICRDGTRWTPSTAGSKNEWSNTSSPPTCRQSEYINYNGVAEFKQSSQMGHSELHLVPTLRMSGAILLHPISAIMAGT